MKILNFISVLKDGARDFPTFLQNSDFVRFFSSPNETPISFGIINEKDSISFRNWNLGRRELNYPRQIGVWRGGIAISALKDGAIDF